MVLPFAEVKMDGLMVFPNQGSRKVTKKMSLEQFQKTIDINLTGVFLTVRECVENKNSHNYKGLICLVSSNGFLGTVGQINYPSIKTAILANSMEFTVEFFRRGFTNKIFCEAIVPENVTTSILEEVNQETLENILADVPIRRLVDSTQVTSLACELYRNEALAGEAFFIHGGLRAALNG